MGIEYIESSQIFLLKPDIILNLNISPSAISDLIYALQNCFYKLPKSQIGIQKHLTDHDQKQVENAYLKGVTIKNLAIQYGVDESFIERLLMHKDLPIVDNENPKFYNKYRRRKMGN
jgi:hypothetical protein